jgi:hypothetical protein
MKNPRIAVAMAPDYAFPLTSGMDGNAVLHVLDQTSSGSLKAGKDGKSGTALQSTLEFFKVDASEIAMITSVVGTVTSMASIIGFSISAVSTVKDLLDQLGILKKPEDPSLKLLKAIQEKVEQIYAYLVNTEKRGLYEKAIEWRVQISTVQNDLGNLALARSASDVDSAIASVKSLAQAIEMMLDVGQGDIALLRATYGWQPGLPMMWIGAATPLFMVKTDGSPVDYRDNNKDLAATIWDPGYYFDVLLQAIAVRVAAVAALEPAFRSTGYDRTNLHAIYDELGAFIKKWEGSFITSRIVGPISPDLNGLVGGHDVVNNPMWWKHGWPDASIPLGFIDPVTGISSFAAAWGVNYPEKAIMMERPSYILGQNSHWVTDNYDGVVAAATAALEAMRVEVRAQCGILRLYELSHSLWNLIAGVGGSEFVDPSDALFSSSYLRSKAESEDLSLGVVGVFAGNPDHKYPAQRYYQDIAKSFHFQMARRSDVTRTQLGYKLVISLGGADGTQEIVLTEFSSSASPFQPEAELPFFPTDPISVNFTASAATVYDVVQSKILTASEEDIFEKTGMLPDTHEQSVVAKRGHRPVIVQPQYRTFLNPRPGRVHLKVDVTFKFDLQAPGHPFLGTAYVGVVCQDAEANPYGFIAQVEIFETVIVGEPGVPATQLAATMALHFAPSFLLVGHDYFQDREKGFKAMDDIFGKTNKDYAISKAPEGPIDPIDPIAQVARQAAVEHSIAAFATHQLREAPAQLSVQLAGLRERVATQMPALR